MIVVYKVRSAALVYTVFLLLIILGALGILIIAVQLQRHYLLFIQKKEMLTNYCNDGIRVLLGSDDLIREGDSLQISLYGTENDMVILTRKRWGLFDLIQSRSGSGKWIVSKTAFAGSWYKTSKKPALYLTDRGYPLSLAGTTKVIGNCFLPAQGVRCGTIDGQYYSKDTLVYGKIFKAQLELPVLRDSLLQNLSIESFKKDIYNKLVSSNHTTENCNSFTVSFSHPTRYIYNYSTLTLSGTSLSGNIVVISDRKIFVDSTAILTDVILVAPVVIINHGFSGSVQVFASDSILLGKNVKLQYPSSLFCSKYNSDKSEGLSSFIGIESNCIIHGCIFNNSGTNSRTKASVCIGSNSVVTGIVYCKGLTELNGDISGTLLTDGFLVISPTSTYENYLYNAIISSESLPNPFVAPDLFNKFQPRKIMKWLN